MLTRVWFFGLAAAGFSGWPVYFFSAQFALLGVIADSEYVDNMGYSGRQRSMPTLVGLV